VEGLIGTTAHSRPERAVPWELASTIDAALQVDRPEGAAL